MLFYDPVYCDYMDSLCVVEPPPVNISQKNPTKPVYLICEWYTCLR